MHGNQFTNVLTLAAALSMAGWVARPDGNQNHFTNFNNQNYNYQNRFHPYQQPQANQLRSNNHLQQQQQFQNGPLVAQAVAPQYNLNPTQNNLYQSKDAEDTFRAYLELQELISWQESYRRGDLMPQQNTNQQFVLPVSNPESIENKFSSGNDDGYGTCSSVGSPASTTQLGSEVDNLSVHSNSPSPQPNTFNFDQDLNGQSQPFQQINSPLEDGVFDIDEILNDEQGAMSPVMPYNDEIPKGPFASLLSSLDQDLEYADSPALKNPSFDSFLTKPSPEYKPPYTYSQKYEDPFNIKFTNGSLPEGFSQEETLVDIGSFDPSIFEENTESQDDILDKALVQSLHQKENPATVAIKQEEDDNYWLRPQSPMVEHDYFNRDEMKPLQTANPVTKHQPQIIQRPVTFAPNRRQQPLPMTPTTTRILGRRTFAPSHSATASGLSNSKPSSIKPKVKQQKQKSLFLWNDFQYTALDLVEMPVEKFNEVIKQLDEVRQHIAKDERRKGKNKLAARNCRKRKMDVIENLDSGVNVLEQKRQELLKERRRILDETRQIKLKTEWLNDYIFKHIKDSNGLPYNENDYSLKYTADGNVYVVPVGVGNNGN